MQLNEIKEKNLKWISAWMINKETQYRADRNHKDSPGLESGI